MAAHGIHTPLYSILCVIIVTNRGYLAIHRYRNGLLSSVKEFLKILQELLITKGIK